MILFPGTSALLDPLAVSLPGVMFGTVDEFGTRLTISEESGLFGSPGFRRGRADRPSQHGTFTVQGYGDGRSITLTGNGFAQTPAAAVASMRVLSTVLSDGGSGSLDLYGPDGSTVLTALVQRDGPVAIRFTSDVNFAWQMTLFAPDRRLYGEAQTDSAGLPSHGGGLSYPLTYPLTYGAAGDPGRVTVMNSGNAPSEPVFTVTSTLDVGFEITRVETGQRLRYEHPVTSTLTLDCASGMVTTDGQRRERYLTVRQWPSLAAGESATFQFSTLGSETPSTTSASLSVSLSPAYS